MQKQYFQSDLFSQQICCRIIDLSRASSTPGAVSEEPVNRVMMKGGEQGRKCQDSSLIIEEPDEELKPKEHLLKAAMGLKEKKRPSSFGTHTPTRVGVRVPKQHLTEAAKS